MSGPRIDHEPRADDRRRERFLVASSQDAIPIAPHDEGRGLDPLELAERSSSKRPSKAALHTRAGTFRASCTKESKNSSGTGMGGGDRRSQTQSVHERRQVRREVVEVVTLQGVARIPVAPLCEGQGADGFGEVMQKRPEGAPRVSEAWQE